MIKLTPSQALRLANFAYTARKLVEAEDICRQIINASPDLFDAHYLLAFVQLRLGKKIAALASYDRALTVQPDHIEALSNRANALQEEGRYEEARLSYDRALAVQPFSAVTLSNRGTALRKLNRAGDALVSYER